MRVSESERTSHSSSIDFVALKRRRFYPSSKMVINASNSFSRRCKDMNRFPSFGPREKALSGAQAVPDQAALISRADFLAVASCGPPGLISR
jgi:hypothetical protein